MASSKGVEMFGIAAVLLTVSGVQGSPDVALSPGTFVEFSAEGLGGRAVRSESLKGSVTVLVLWGTWSPGASRSLETAEAVRDKYSPRGVRVVSLACWDDLPSVSSFKAANTQLKFEFWWDPAGKEPTNSIATRVFKTRRFPTFYVMDKQMRVVQGFVGMKVGQRPELEGAIDKTLGL